VVEQCSPKFSFTAFYWGNHGLKELEMLPLSCYSYFFHRISIGRNFAIP